SGKSTDVLKNFALGLNSLLPPTSVVVQAFACDSAVAHNCGVTSAVFSTPSPTGTARKDTIVIVAGTTKILPFGGKIVDAIYSANRRELYLTNPSLSRVEIFQAANSTFVVAGIPTAGPQPWGIALLPRDTLGADGDSIVVANSGNPPDTSKLFGHIFWEISNAPPSSTSDTLRIVERRGPPYNVSKVTLTACAGANVELQSFALGDTTFARNSGNFTHGFFGE